MRLLFLHKSVGCARLFFQQAHKRVGCAKLAPISRLKLSSATASNNYLLYVLVVYSATMLLSLLRSLSSVR